MRPCDKFKCLFESGSSEYSPPSSFDLFAEGLWYDEIQVDGVIYRTLEKSPETPFEIKVSNSSSFDRVAHLIEHINLQEYLICEKFVPDAQWTEIERGELTGDAYAVYESMNDFTRIRITTNSDHHILSLSLADNNLLADSCCERGIVEKAEEIWLNASALNIKIDGKLWSNESIKGRKGWEQSIVYAVRLTPSQLEFREECQEIGEQAKSVLPPSELSKEVVNSYNVSVRSVDQDKVIARALLTGLESTEIQYWIFQLGEDEVKQLGDDLESRQTLQIGGGG